MRRVLVTGANGFVGRAVGPALAAAGWEVLGAVRRQVDLPAAIRPVAGPDLGPEADWSGALSGCEAVVHLAARVHVMTDEAPDRLEAFRRANRDGTRRLAAQAAASGVKRLVFVSSVKAMGGATDGSPFRETDVPRPGDPYGISKLEAEEALMDVSRATGLEAVVLRPPLVYGPGVKANFASLVRLVRRGVPLPLGAVNNRRSLIFVGNLADAVRVSLEHPSAAGKRFLVRDGEDLSTPDLIRRMGRAMGREARLLPVPPALLRLGAAAVGAKAAAERLLGSLAVDDTLIRRTLDWSPPYTVDQGLRATVLPE